MRISFDLDDTLKRPESVEQFKCRDTACFIAYYVARSNLRSEFTIYGQQRAYDEIADMLLDRCRKNTATNWVAIAYVYPTKEVLVLSGGNKVSINRLLLARSKADGCLDRNARLRYLGAISVADG